ncbi:MAG: single-stranded DNA-binding protein [Chloroflexota bacterium]
MFQQVIVVGNLGNDPEMRYTPNGASVTTFSLASNRKWTDRQSGEKREEVTWWRVSVFGAQAESCSQYLSKGRQVMVIGRLRPDPNTGSPRVFTRQDGTSGASFELSATSVQFLGRREGMESSSPQTPSSPQDPMDAEGLPF